MDKKELNFLLKISNKLSSEVVTKKEADEISEYFKKHFNTITLEINNEFKGEIKEETNKYKKHGKGYKKKHRKQVKKKKLNRY